MTGLVAFPEFDPALHPIGHALCIELLPTDPSRDCREMPTPFSSAPATAKSFDWFEANAA
jgi:hypothetical protein